MDTARLLNNPLTSGLLDFLFPPLCLGCGEYCEDEPCICARCRARIETFTTLTCLTCGAMIPLEQSCPICRERFFPLFAFGNYVAPFTEIIRQFKFKGITSPARWIAPLVCDQFGESLYSRASRVDGLIPIPLHPSRQHARGYNQAEVFARALGDKLLLPVVTDLLYRAKRRRPQARIDREQRARNIRGVFEVDRTPAESGRYILVDDVVTTGATVREAKRVLLQSGHRVIGVISMAHGV